MDTLEGVGVVAHPELVEPREHAPVGTSAAGSTCLDGDIRIFSTDPVADLRKSAVIFDVEMALPVLRKVL